MKATVTELFEHGIETADGASASVEREGDVETLRVRDAAGALIFEHRPAEGRSIVYAPHGDLAFRAERGSIDFEAADAVRVRGRREVSVESEKAVHIAATDTDGRSWSQLSLARRAALLWAPKIKARAAGADVHVDEAHLEADEVHTKVGRMFQVVEVLDTQAGRILERAKETYRETEGLSQTKAGRLRLVAEKTLTALGDRTLFKARKDMKLRGEKIYLC